MARDRATLSGRLEKISSVLSEQEVGGVLFLNLKNIRYLVGFSGSDGALVVSGKKTVLLVDGRYTTQAGRETRGIDVVQYKEKAEGIVSVCSDLGVRVLGFEASSITCDFYRTLLKKLKDVRLRCLTEDHLGGLRAVKDGGEVRQIRKAVAIATRALKATLPLIRPGVQERDIALELDYRIKKEGADALSFDTIVASGSNGALPHARPGSRKIKKGDFLIIDYGAVYRGYHSDETCTFAVGPVGKRQKEAYAAVKEAHDRAIEAVRAGAECREIDGIARRTLESKGLGKYFTHGTGHGIGLDVHEEPRLTVTSNGRLEPGMVITVEPGVYIPGRWGIRLEDSMLVRENGCEILTPFSKDLQTLG